MTLMFAMKISTSWAARAGQATAAKPVKGGGGGEEGRA
jgi:hypothetical protein